MGLFSGSCGPKTNTFIGFIVSSKGLIRAAGFFLQGYLKCSQFAQQLVRNIFVSVFLLLPNN